MVKKIKPEDLPPVRARGTPSRSFMIEAIRQVQKGLLNQPQLLPFPPPDEIPTDPPDDFDEPDTLVEFNLQEPEAPPPDEIVTDPE